MVGPLLTCLICVLAVLCHEGVNAESELARWRREVVMNVTGYETHVMRQRRQTTCATDEFPCKQGSRCIQASEVCDGEIHCPDNSDESFSLCSKKEFTCPDSSYRCSYGACVDGDAMCNGDYDCADQSDEMQPECEGVVSKVENSLCQDSEFTCLTTNQCIGLSRRCDGYVDCDDGTDETITQCSRISCEPPTFRCAYGACVPADAPCDGSAQCRDGSDELAPQCTFARPAPTNFHIDATTQPGIVPTFASKPFTTREPPRQPNTPPTFGGQPSKPSRSRPCQLPAAPENGAFTSYLCEQGSKEPECSGVEGTKVAPGYTLHFECFPGYGLRGQADLTCRNGNWYPKVPFCSDECEPLLSGKLQITCLNERNQYANCLKPVSGGTKAFFKCNPASYMEIVDPGYRKIVCKNGEWDRPLVENFCQPVCGRANDDLAQPVVSGGKQTEYGQFPWHAGIYDLDPKTKNYDLICGGSLINTKVVISAAHCFYDEVQGHRDLVPKNLTNMRIAMGKYYREYSNVNDTLAQDRGISKVEIEPDYRASLGLFSDDIAFVVLEKPVSFTFAVRPVCMDVGKTSVEDDQLIKGAMGQVVGWGLTSNQKPSKTLILAEMPFVPREECRLTISDRLVSYVTSDKMCAGDKKSRTNVCPGDSGGGLVFFSEQRKAFYLRGIVSLGTRGCTGQDYALFTRIGKHTAAVEKYLSLD